MGREFVFEPTLESLVRDLQECKQQRQRAEEQAVELKRKERRLLQQVQTRCGQEGHRLESSETVDEEVCTICGAIYTVYHYVDDVVRVPGRRVRSLDYRELNSHVVQNQFLPLDWRGRRD
jgi:chromosome segregation ATPase